MYYFPTRQEMMAAVTKPESKICEVGVFRGEFANFLANLKPSLLVLVDPWNGILTSGDADGNNVTQVNGEEVYKSISEQTKGVPFLEVLRAKSETVLPKFPDEYFDVIYIDGDHSFEGCSKDLELARKKVKKGGWICGHDYEMNELKAKNVYYFGVNQAVDVFCAKYGLKIRALGLDGCVSYAIPNL